jgi:hypothetical protein
MMWGLIALLGCGPGLAQAADAEQFAQELGAFTVSAAGCSSHLADTIEKCLDEVMAAYGFEGKDKERLLQAYQAGVAKAKEHPESDAHSGCGDIVRGIRGQPFWARCPEQAKERSK